MTGSRELHHLLGMEPPDPVQLSPGEVAIAVDEGLVVLKLDSADESFKVAMEPAAAVQIGLRLVDEAMRACRGLWTAER